MSASCPGSFKVAALDMRCDDETTYCGYLQNSRRDYLAQDNEKIQHWNYTKMKFNEDDLVFMAQGSPQFEGRLEHRAPSSFRDSGYRKRFFKLIGNMLFCFRFTDHGTVDTKEPVGVIILENYSVQPEHEETEVSFSFSILFLDEPDKKHIFCARTDEDVQKWVNALQQASYQHWREKMNSMQIHVNALREARKSPFLFQNGRFQNPRPNPFASPQLQRRPQASSSSGESLEATLQPPPALPPRTNRRNLSASPSSSSLVITNECGDLIQL